MKIDSYTFGSVTIEGELYNKDVIVFPGRVQPNWWRKAGHSLSPDDLETVAAAGPDSLIVGCGMHGAMTVPEATKTWIASRGMELIAVRSQEAVEMYNQLEDKAGTVLCLHLTC